MSHRAWEAGKRCNSENNLRQRAPTHWHTILTDFCSIPSKAEVTLSNIFYVHTTWCSQWTCSKSRTLVTKQHLIKTMKILKIMSENYSGIRWHSVISINSIDSIFRCCMMVAQASPNAAPDDSRYSRSVQLFCSVSSLWAARDPIQCSIYR